MVLPFLLLALMVGGGIGLPVQAQEERGREEPLRLEVLGGGEVAIHLGDILSDPALVEAVESGLPLRLEVVVQLWRDGFFDSQVGQARWRANVFYDALEGEYVLQVDDGAGAETGGNEDPDTGPDGDGVDTRSRDDRDPPSPSTGTQVARTFSTMADLREALPRVIEPPLGPDEEGSYYYLSRLSVETLSLSDLEELRRWLRGDLAPAISGDGDVEGAAERGLRRTVIRLLGMPTRRFDARTSTFEHSPTGD